MATGTGSRSTKFWSVNARDRCGVEDMEALAQDQEMVRKRSCCQCAQQYNVKPDRGGRTTQPSSARDKQGADPSEQQRNALDGSGTANIVCMLVVTEYRGSGGRKKSVVSPGDDAAPLDIENQVRKSHLAKDQLARHRERRFADKSRSSVQG